MTNKLIEEGWYLLSGISGETCRNIINSYNPASYLDISSIYIPLYKDFSSNIFSLAPSNQVTDISVSDLVFNQTIGSILEYNNYRANLFGRVIDFSNITFSENVGFWVYMKLIQTNPVLHLTITNPEIEGFPTILSINGDTTFSSPIQFDFSRNDISINLLVERTFNFEYNKIFTSVVVSDNDYTGFNGTSGNSNNNDISFINFTGTYSNLKMDTDSSSNTGKIIFTVINSTPNTDESFNVIVNIDVSDTIFPRIEIDSTNYRGNNSNNKFHKIILLNQSNIFNSPTDDLSPLAYWYDQTSTTSGVQITPEYSNSTIYNPITKTSTDISYTPGEWKPGSYNIRYSAVDSFNHQTIVDVSFEIVDNIFPLITIVNEVSDINGYTNFQENNNYTTFTYDDSADISFGVGFKLTTAFNSLSNGDTSNYTTSENNDIIYLYYSDVSGSTSWKYPIISKGIDFSNIDISGLVSNNINDDNINQNNNTIEISNVNILNTIGSYNGHNPSIIRNYSLVDLHHNTSNLNLNVKVYDDIVPEISINFVHVRFKYELYGKNAPSYEQTDPSYILVNNIRDANKTPIVIDQYDKITFNLSTNKPCTWRIGYKKQDGSEQNGSVNSSNQIDLDYKDTDVSGITNLIFRIWDANENYFSFRYDLSINEIPAYSIKIYTDPIGSSSRKHRLLLRGNSNSQNFYPYFVNLFLYLKTDPILNDYVNKIAIQSSKRFYLYKIFTLPSVNILDALLNGSYQGYSNTVVGLSTNKTGWYLDRPTDPTKDILQFKSANMITGIFYELMQFDYYATDIANISSVNDPNSSYLQYFQVNLNSGDERWNSNHIENVNTSVGIY